MAAYEPSSLLVVPTAHKNRYQLSYDAGDILLRRRLRFTILLHRRLGVATAARTTGRQATTTLASPGSFGAGSTDMRFRHSYYSAP